MQKYGITTNPGSKTNLDKLINIDKQKLSITNLFSEQLSSRAKQSELEILETTSNQQRFQNMSKNGNNGG